MYDFTFKKRWFYKTIKAKGHHYAVDEDRMDVFLASDEGIFSIPKWSEYTLKLGSDFILFSKQKVKDEAQ